MSDSSRKDQLDPIYFGIRYISFPTAHFVTIRGYNGSNYSRFGLYHGFKVTVSVRFGVCDIQDKKGLLSNNQTTRDSTNKYNGENIQIKNSAFQVGLTIVFRYRN